MFRIKGINRKDFMPFLFLLLLGTVASAEMKFEDLTTKKWSGNEEPKLSISEMEIKAPPPEQKTTALWKVSSKVSCPSYDLNFLVEDMKGAPILREVKRYRYDGNGNETNFNKDFSNIISSGSENEARFSKNFHERTYVTVKYWISNLKCTASETASQQGFQPDNVGFSLDDQLKRANENE